MRDDARKKLLLVEDEAIIAMATQATLEKYGYEVLTAARGEEAVAAVEADPGIDLVLMDIDLGRGMDGTEAAALILNQRDLPVLFLSSHMEPEVVEKTEKITSYGYVVKHSTATVLDASVKMAFKLFAAKKKEEEKEAALLRSEEKYHTLFREMLDGFALHEIICDADGAPVDYRFLAVNPAFERMTGLKAAQLIGRTVLEVMPGTERHWIDTYGRVALRGEPALFESYASELKKYFKVTAFQPTPGQFACIFVEITENKLTEEALKKSQLLLQSSIESPKDMIILSIDRQYRYLYFNSYHKEVMKAVYGKDVELGMNLLECITNDDDRIKAKINYDRALAGERHSTIEEYGDLSRQFYETRYNPISNEENEIIGATAFSADVSERMRSEAAMSESEARFRTLATILPVGIYLTDIQGRCRYANPRWLRMAGLTMEEALGDGWKQGLHPEDREAVFAAWQRTVESEGSWGLEYRFRAKNGTVTWVHGLAAPQRDLQGRTIGYVGANIDITASKRAEEELRAGEERMRAIVEGTPHLFFYVQDSEANTVYVSPTIETITGYPPDVWMKRRDWFVTDAACNREAQALTHSHLRGEGAGEPVRLEIRHAQGHPILLEAYEYPLRRGDRVIGLQGVAHDITERIRAEEALRESEERFRAVVDHSPYAILLTAPDGSILSANSAAELLFGRSTEEIMRVGRGGVIDVSDPRLAPALAERARSGRFHGELTFIRANGEKFPAEISSNLFRDREGHERTSMIIRDVSERKRAEEERLRSEQKYRSLVEGHQDVIFSVDLDGRVEYISPAITRITGMKREELEGNSLFDALAPADREAFSAHMHRTITDGSAVGEYPVSAADGTTRWIRASSHVREKSGHVAGIHGIISDITEHRGGELALRESEERFRTLYENSPLGLYRTSPDGRVLMANPALVSMLGFSSYAELAGRELARNGFADATDRGHFVGQIERDGAVNGLEAVWKRRDGTEVTVRESARAVRDEAGRTRFYDGIVEDVTDLKRAERLMETLYGISQAVHSSRDLPVLYRRIHGLIGGIANAANFFIAVLSEDGATLEFPYYQDEKDRDNSPVRADDPQSLTVEVLRTRKPLLLDEDQLKERYAAGTSRVWGTMPRCWLGIPLGTPDRTIGVMAIQDYGNGHAYGPSEMALLEATAGQIAVAIERKRAEDALRESMAAFKGYFNMGMVGMCVTSLDKGWIEVNDRLCLMLGYAKDELRRMTWAELTHPDDLDADVGLFNEMLAGKRDSYELEKRFVRKDGQVIHTRLYANCQRNADGTVHHFLAALVDISERKRAEEALRQSEAELSNAMQIAKAGHWEYDIDRDLFTFNDNFYRIFRTTAEAVGGYQMSSAEYAKRFCHPEDMPMVAEETRRAIEAPDAGFNRQVEHRILYADGKIGIISVRIFITKDDRGRTVKTYGVNQDITELKWAESEIKRQLEEKNVLLKEVHHRIKNNFASVAGLLALQAQQAGHEAAAALQEAAGRIDSMRLLYDKLLLREDYTEASVKEYVESLAAAVVEPFHGLVQIRLELDVADFPLPAKRLFPLGIILNELLTNAAKHAFPGRKSGRIRLSLAKTAGRASFVLEDDGAGLPDGFDLEKAHGFGLMLVRMLSKQLGGTFAMTSGKKGTRSEIAFDAE